jgi:hypothetical protein
MPLKDLVKEDAVDEAAEADAEQNSRTAKTRYGLLNLLLAGGANSHAGACLCEPGAILGRLEMRFAALCAGRRD